MNQEIKIIEAAHRLVWKILNDKIAPISNPELVWNIGMEPYPSELDSLSQLIDEFYDDRKKDVPLRLGRLMEK